MEHIRKRLYELAAVKPLPVFNPASMPDELPAYPVVDITSITDVDVEQVEKKATLIICDSIANTTAMRLAVNNKVLCATMPYGYEVAQDTEDEKGRRLGILAYDESSRIIAEKHTKLLNMFKEDLLIFGEELEGLSQEQDHDYVNSLEEFAGRCDVLLLPQSPLHSSMSTVLCVLASRATVIAHNSGGAYGLNSLPGARLVSDMHKKTWAPVIKYLRDDPAKLEALKLRNKSAVERLSQESIRRLQAAYRRLDKF